MSDISQRVEWNAPRIAILDANELDNEILAIFKSQINVFTKYLPPWLMITFGPEIDTLLKFVIWKISVSKSKATLGQQLLHLSYDNSSNKNKLTALAIFTILGSYLKERMNSCSSALSPQFAQSVWKVTELVETGYQVANLLSLVKFLRCGGPPTFAESVLRLSPVSTVPPSKRNVGYSYMTRELVWHGFIELLVMVIPLINYHSIKRKINNILVGGGQRGLGGPCVLTVRSKCVVCKESPILPHRIGCPHPFCYMCISSNREADRLFKCPACGFSNPDDNAVQPVTTPYQPVSSLRLQPTIS